MCTEYRRHGGFTLIELIIFIVIVSVGLVGVLSSLNISTKGSADPLQPKQALAIAETLLEEILLKDYCDPTAGEACESVVGESIRGDFDNIGDYNNYTSSPASMLDGTTLTGYSIAVSVPATLVPINTVDMRQIIITVTAPNGSTYRLHGYRAQY